MSGLTLKRSALALLLVFFLLTAISIASSSAIMPTFCLVRRGPLWR